MAPTRVTEVVKETICQKTAVPGMEKQSYLPSCLQQCAAMCGVRCRRKCWIQHQGPCNQQCETPCSVVHPPACRRGELDDSFLFCPSRLGDLELSLAYTKFENADVPTYGKGVAYTRMEKKETEMTESSFTAQFKLDFKTYTEHIVPSWFLRYLTKFTLVYFFMYSETSSLPCGSPPAASQERRSSHLILLKTSQSHENTRPQVNFEISRTFYNFISTDQHFHKPEILLHGTVSTLMVKEGDGILARDTSHLISSDYRHIQHPSQSFNIYLGLKTTRLCTVS